MAMTCQFAAKVSPKSHDFLPTPIANITEQNRQWRIFR
jgi:hypothetical protein